MLNGACAAAYGKPKPNRANASEALASRRKALRHVMAMLSHGRFFEGVVNMKLAFS
jgi:hypothetical protein